MQEFSSFAPAEQRYICRALEVAAGSHSALRRWARDIDEARSIRNQARTYRWRDHVVRLLAEERYLEMAAHLTEISIFDLSQRQIRSFRSEEHTSELQSLMRNSYAGFILKKQTNITQIDFDTKI